MRTARKRNPHLRPHLSELRQYCAGRSMAERTKRSDQRRHEGTGQLFLERPEERVKIREIIDNMVDNQIHDRLEELLAEALNAESQYISSSNDKVKALLAFRNAIVEPYKKCRALAKAGGRQRYDAGDDFRDLIPSGRNQHKGT